MFWGKCGSMPIRIGLCRTFGALEYASYLNPTPGWAKCVARLRRSRLQGESRGELRLRFTVAGVEPAGAVALAARLLVVGACGEAGGAFFPVDFGHAANDAGAALAGNDLRALAANHLRRVGDGSAAGAYCNGLWL